MFCIFTMTVSGLSLCFVYAQYPTVLNTKLWNIHFLVKGFGDINNNLPPLVGLVIGHQSFMYSQVLFLLSLIYHSRIIIFEFLCLQHIYQTVSLASRSDNLKIFRNSIKNFAAASLPWLALEVSPLPQANVTAVKETHTRSSPKASSILCLHFMPLSLSTWTALHNATLIRTSVPSIASKLAQELFTNYFLAACSEILFFLDLRSSSYTI
jgi:hypothetical protein